MDDSDNLIGYIALGIFSTFILVIISICICGSCCPACNIKCCKNCCIRHCTNNCTKCDNTNYSEDNYQQI